MIFKYSIDNRKRRKYFFNNIILVLIIDITITALMHFIYNLSFVVMIKTFLVLFVLTFLFYLLPLIILYLNYLKNNRSSKLIINQDNSLITFSFQNIETTFLFSDVKKIKVNLSFPLFDKRMRWFFWDELFYYELILNTNSSIFISCLLCNDLPKSLPSVEIQRIKRVIPIIPHSHVLNRGEFQRKNE